MTLSLRNPATGAVVAEVETDTHASVLEKLARARAARPAWAAQPLEERLATIARFRDRIVEQKSELALTLTRDMGKPITQSRNELAATPARLEFFLENTSAVLEDEPVLRDEGGVSEVIRMEPLGVVANVSAWNYPWFVGTNVFVPALLTGNAVLYKPSEHAVMTGLAIGRLLHEAGVPEDVFAVIVGAGDVGAMLVDAPVDGVFFTGSYRTGRAIAERVAPRMVRLGLELGGKDPIYVRGDVDVARAAESLADGAMYNAGQSCCAVERLYVDSAIYDEFVEAFVRAVRGFVVGDPEDERTYLGPLARAEQREVLDAQVADAVARGAEVLCGGKRVEGPGNYYEPTVIVNATNAMRIMREESFGPVIGIARVPNDERAIELMNDTEYGLTAGVYTRDRARAEHLLARLDAGSVYWNCCDRVSPRLPWTGRRHSGIGSTLSKHGIRAFVQPKAFHLRSGI
ncbi:MAG TPA: aldehyde dehydrogenase family protein [Polyangiaceae bacterium]|nr:aldehyde dehydrogenase family protein [Polyangiaceae bacterium]